MVQAMFEPWQRTRSAGSYLNPLCKKLVPPPPSNDFDLDSVDGMKCKRDPRNLLSVNESSHLFGNSRGTGHDLDRFCPSCSAPTRNPLKKMFRLARTSLGLFRSPRSRLREVVFLRSYTMAYINGKFVSLSSLLTRSVKKTTVLST